MKRVLLTKREIASCLKEHPEWRCNTKETQLSRTFVFDEYVAALVFVARIGVHSEILKHHPTITFTETKVKVLISTVAVHGLTKLDVALVERIDRLPDSA